MNILKQVLLADQHSISLLRKNSQLGLDDVQVTPNDVVLILRRYISGELSDERLHEWADVLVSCESYVSPDWENDNSADLYEPMWDALQQLASPEIDGAITEEKVKQFIECLEKI